MSDPAKTVFIREAAPRLTGFWKEARSTILLGLPLILAQLSQIALNTTDVVMMGWLGPSTLAAGALGSNIYVPILVTGFGLGAAVGAMLARDRGRNPHGVREPRRTVRQGFWICGIYAIPALLVLWNSPSILVALGQDTGLSEKAGGYVRMMMWGLPAALWFVVLRSFVSALERTGVVLAISIAAIFLNAFTNWLLMFGNWGFPRLELRGTGISTTLANFAMLAALSLFIAFDRRTRRYALAGRFWRPDPPRLKQIARLGLPISLMLALEVGVFSASTLLAGLISVETLAAHGIALQIASVAFMVPLGLSQATAIRVGLTSGRGHGVAMAGWTSIILASAFAAMLAIGLVLWRDQLVSLFLKDGDQAMIVARLAGSFLILVAIFQLVDGLQVILASVLRGLQDTAIPMLYAAFGYWAVGMPVGAFLAFTTPLQGLGIWIGLALGLAVVSVLMLWRWTRRGQLGLYGG